MLNEDLVTRRHSVVFRDIDGSKIVSGEGGLSASGRHLFTIEGAVAKIEICEQASFFLFSDDV